MTAQKESKEVGIGDEVEIVSLTESMRRTHPHFLGKTGTVTGFNDARYVHVVFHDESGGTWVREGCVRKLS